LVRTPSDFGVRSEPPSHPELLDYLAVQFIENGWSIKQLHRMIMHSSVYQQASDDRPDQRGIDPDNWLLWRQNRRRLDFEAMRDALLAVSGGIDATFGGLSVDLTKTPYSRRRTVYGFVERQNLPAMFSTFDFASPDTHCPQRYTTTVPQQALFFMNSPFVGEQARRLAALPEVQAQNDPGLRIQRMFRVVLGRHASQQEVALGLEFIQAAPEGERSQPQGSLDAWERYAQVLLLINEFCFVD
jgi:hypothetical protein